MASQLDEQPSRLHGPIEAFDKMANAVKESCTCEEGAVAGLPCGPKHSAQDSYSNLNQEGAAGFVSLDEYVGLERSLPWLTFLAQGLSLFAWSSVPFILSLDGSPSGMISDVLASGSASLSSFPGSPVSQGSPSCRVAWPPRVPVPRSLG